MTKLFTESERLQLLANGQASAQGREIDPFPVVRIHLPDGDATWLLTELDPSDHDVAFGLCDLGLGEPELGTVRISQIKAIRGPAGFPPERLEFFQATAPLSQYAEKASIRGKIVPMVIGRSLVERLEFYDPRPRGHADDTEGPDDSLSGSTP